MQQEKEISGGREQPYRQRKQHGGRLSIGVYAQKKSERKRGVECEVNWHPKLRASDFI
jgi:hypothetical protein